MWVIWSPSREAAAAVVGPIAATTGGAAVPIAVDPRRRRPTRWRSRRHRPERCGPLAPRRRSQHRPVRGDRFDVEPGRSQTRSTTVSSARSACATSHTTRPFAGERLHEIGAGLPRRARRRPTRPRAPPAPPPSPNRRRPIATPGCAGGRGADPLGTVPRRHHQPVERDRGRRGRRRAAVDRRLDRGSAGRERRRHRRQRAASRGGRADHAW